MKILICSGGGPVTGWVEVRREKNEEGWDICQLPWLNAWGGGGGEWNEAQPWNSGNREEEDGLERKN